MDQACCSSRQLLYSGNLLSELQRNSVVPLLLSRDPALINALNSDDFSQSSARLISYREEIEAAGMLFSGLSPDGRLPEIVAKMNHDDLLVLTADHGCDPTWPGSDHTREHIPVLVSGPKVPAGSLGRRDTFADIGQSLAEYFGTSDMDYGKSFL